MYDLECIRQMVMKEIDLTAEVSDKELYQKIDEIILRLSKECFFPISERIRCRKALYDSFRRLDILSEALDMEGVTEVMVNGPNCIYIEQDGELKAFPKTFSNPEKLEDVIQQIAARVNRRVDEASPMVDARLADGSRVNIVLPPASLDGPVITIRRFPDKPPDMEQLMNWGALNEQAVSLLKQLVQARYNIFISGGTGSGKTTFLGALAGFIRPDERIITIEDSAELRLLQVKNLVRLETRSANQEGNYEITIRDLIRNSLRMRPDRIIIGEIRGAEALDMIQAMNTGHDGSMSTGHANSPIDMLHRIETMVLMGSSLPLPAIRAQIVSAIDIIVHLGRQRDKKRRVVSISEVRGLKEGEFCLNTLFHFREKGEAHGTIIGELECCGGLVRTGKLCDAGFIPSSEQD